MDDRRILDDNEIALLTALLTAVPAIGQWVGGLLHGNDVDPTATRRVRDILPEPSASAVVADELATAAAHRDGF